MLDFSKADSDAIRKLVDRVKAVIASNPNSPNVKEQQAYVDAGEAELSKRQMQGFILVGGLLTLAFFAFKK